MGIEVVASGSPILVLCYCYTARTYACHFCKGISSFGFGTVWEEENVKVIYSQIVPSAAGSQYKSPVAKKKELDTSYSGSS